MPIANSTSRTFFRWRPACWLSVTGSDAANFLQGQFTNELRAIKSSDAIYGLWLTVKGKVLADSFVGRGAGKDEFWIVSYHSPADVIRARLESYIIADDVVITDETEAWAAVSVLDADAQRPLIQSDLATGIVFRGRRDATGGIECAYRIAGGEPAGLTRHIAAARELDGEEIARRRIAAAVPEIPRDVGPGDLPNEASLEADAISYTKGCYLGQEVMARLKSMGQVRRRLVRVRGTEGSNPPAIPAPVFVGARQVGDVRSLVSDGAGGWIGLAMVSLLALGGSATLSLSADSPPQVTVLDAP
jgi:folate-binding protein YgfZ